MAIQRPSGRSPGEMRQVRFTRGFTKHAAGSVLVEFGDTKVICTASVDQSVPGYLRGKGVGWVTAECLVYDEGGRLLSHSPTTYKIPAITDVPIDFRCDFFPNDDNLHCIRRSKAVGEPPLLLGVAVWAAVKQALSQVEGDVDPNLQLPATGEEILRCLSQ